MIDLMQEHLVPLRDVPKLLPPRPNGRPLHVSACYRWTEKGINGARLEAVRIGGTTYTSREALQRFANHLSQAAQVPAARRPNPPERASRTVPTDIDARARIIFGQRRPVAGRTPQATQEVPPARPRIA